MLYFDKFYVYGLMDVLDSGPSPYWGELTVSAFHRLADLGVVHAIPDLATWGLDTTLMNETRELVAQMEARRKFAQSEHQRMQEISEKVKRGMAIVEEMNGSNDHQELYKKWGGRESIVRAYETLKEMQPFIQLDHMGKELTALERLIDDKMTSSHMLMRLAAIEIERRFPEKHCLPFLPSYPRLENTQHYRKQEVLGIVLRAFPEPDVSTPLEAILEFRADPEARRRFLALRNWQADVANTGLSAKEIAERLEYLLIQYRDYMESQKVRFRAGVLETVVVATAEIIENLATFHWSKAIKQLFDLRRREIQLYEAEKYAPGREVAYIAKAHDLLDGSDSAAVC